MRQPAKKVTRIFVARIPPSVSESDFRRYTPICFTVVSNNCGERV